MQLNRFCLVLVLVIFMSSFCYAEDFTVNFNVLNREIFPPEEAAVYKITLTNNQDIEDRFDLSFLDMLEYRLYYTVPERHTFTKYSFDIKPNSSDNFLLYVYASNKTKSGAKYITIKFTSENTKKVIEENLPIFIKTSQDSNFDYVSDVGYAITDSFIPLVNPSEDLSFDLRVWNKNSKTIGKVIVALSGPLVGTSEEVFSLSPDERKVIPYKFTFDPLLKPQDSYFTITVTADGKQMTYKGLPSLRQDFTVIDYSTIVKSETDNSRFLINEKLLSVKNNGNIKSSESILFKTSLFDSLFTKTSPKMGVVKINGERYYNWSVELMPSEEKSGLYSVSYRLPFYLLLALVIFYFAYPLIRGPLIVKKTAKRLDKNVDGISELQVLIELKNTSIDPIDSIEVVDKVPNIADISDKSSNTIKPAKITKSDTTGKTIIKWNIDDLDGKENRVLVYNLKYRLSILGNFFLPPTTVRYRTKSGNVRVTRSERVEIKP